MNDTPDHHSGFTLDNIVPWGRSFAEYVAMFDLTDDDLQCTILGCGDGPAAFNAELTGRGGRIVSVDPLYAFAAEPIRERIAQTYDTVMAQMHKYRSDYLWTSIESVEALGRIRMSAMEAFLSDYDRGKAEGRYIPGALPTLPFGEQEFDIALSSHFLFLYSAHLSTEFHLHSLEEMLRVAREVRVFPLLALDGAPSSHLHPVMEQLERCGFETEIRSVPYEFQKGADRMLRIRRTCRPAAGMR